MTVTTGFGARGFGTARSSAARLDRFASDAVITASPAQLLIRLFDRLLLDIERGEAAQRAGSWLEAGEQLVHAQAIVSELASSLDVEAWDGAEQLLSVYTFLLAELVRANVDREPDRTSVCRRMVEPLADAWRQAAVLAAATTQPAPTARVGAVG